MSQDIQEAVYKQQEVIKDKQLSVKEDLDQVEPAVIEAQNGALIVMHRSTRGRPILLYYLVFLPCLISKHSWIKMRLLDKNRESKYYEFTSD